MGSTDPRGDPGDGERPVHHVELAAFAIDAVAVSNERFAAFAGATGHRTDAERFGWSFVFAGLLPDDFAADACRRRNAVVATGRGRRLAPSGRAAARRSTVATTTRPCTCRGTTPRLLRVGWLPAAHRGRVGAGGAWWTPQRVPVGRRARTGRRAPDERLPGHVPAHQHGRRRVRRHGTRRRLRAERRRALQRHRQRLGVVRRLVRPDATTATARAAIRPDRRQGRTASCAVGRTCATPRTAGATGCRRAAPTHRTPPPATSASASPPTGERRRDAGRRITSSRVRREASDRVCTRLGRTQSTAPIRSARPPRGGLT